MVYYPHMDSFNKVLSFVLGLVVVVVFIAVASKRLNLNTKFLPFSSGVANKVTVIPTPSPVAKTGQKIQTIVLNTVQNQNKTNDKTTTTINRYQTTTPTTIPSTGPALLFPISVSSLLGGFVLRQKGRK